MNYVRRLENDLVKLREEMDKRMDSDERTTLEAIGDLYEKLGVFCDALFKIFVFLERGGVINKADRMELQDIMTKMISDEKLRNALLDAIYKEGIKVSGEEGDE